MTDGRSGTDRIEKTVELAAPVERVWRALTDHEEFGRWFRVKLDGPFVVGSTVTGQITYPEVEHYRWLSTTTRMDEEAGVFAFTWVHPADPTRPRPDDPETLVEFRLEPTSDGTRLTVTESGFDALPEDRRSQVMRDNEQGWEIQVGNIREHVEG